MDTYHQLTSVKITTRQAKRLTGIARSSADRDRRRPTPSRPARRAPANTACPAGTGECAHSGRTCTGAAVVEQSGVRRRRPARIYAALLDQGVYVGSIATMYRLLREHEQVRERRRQARHPARTRPELVADAPGQVYSWDITKLAGPVKGAYFDAYVVIDIYSRYIVGVRVHARESGPLAENMTRARCSAPTASRTWCTPTGAP